MKDPDGPLIQPAQRKLPQLKEGRAAEQEKKRSKTNQFSIREELFD
jgi:hypothetical protein